MNNWNIYLGKIPQLNASEIQYPPDTIGYDASGRMTSDYSRGITKITYNPLDLPSEIKMGSKDRINYTYRSDGVKMREQSAHQYTKLVMRISASGDTTYVQRNASDTHYRAHYGNYVKETGMPDRIYNEEGYIALHGDSVSYHFFERDYLGSVRAVFDLYGNLEQTNDYNVTGIPSSRHLGNADVHKHTGKEFQGFNGLAWYDNNARYYDPILARFTTQDPLAEKYPGLSPYNHCANNPLRFVDRDGMEFNENMTEEERQAYHEIIDPLLANSSLFKSVYDFIDSHEDVITVQFGETVKDVNGCHVHGQFNATDRTITFLNSQSVSSSTAIEEIYHSYQNLTPSPEDATTNLEFEAKTVVIFSTNEYGLFGGDDVLSKYSNFIANNMFDSNDNIISNCDILNNQYLKSGNDFVKQHILLNSNSHYTIPVTFIPSRLSNLLKTLRK